MVRDPMANVVSRFRSLRLFREAMVGKVNYQDGSAGFHTFCADMDKENVKEEEVTRYFPVEIMELLADVPCRDEFFKYMQWHNLAGQETEFRSYPSMVLYYEDFEGDGLEASVRSLGSFIGLLDEKDKLDLSDQSKLPNFLGANMYRDYYSDKQIVAIWKFLEAASFPNTWNILAKYR